MALIIDIIDPINHIYRPNINPLFMYDGENEFVENAVKKVRDHLFDVQEDAVFEINFCQASDTLGSIMASKNKKASLKGCLEETIKVFHRLNDLLFHDCLDTKEQLSGALQMLAHSHRAYSCRTPRSVSQSVFPNKPYTNREWIEGELRIRNEPTPHPVNLEFNMIVTKYGINLKSSIGDQRFEILPIVIK